MFITRVVQFFLVTFTLSLVYYALTTIIRDHRDAREARRNFSAKLYANSEICDRILEGTYDGLPPHVIQKDIRELQTKHYLSN